MAMTETEHNWAKICGEIVVAAYGTRIVGEKDGWPLCLFPLEECRDDGSGTLHTYRYEAVPRYYKEPSEVAQLEDYLHWSRQWVSASRWQWLSSPDEPGKKEYYVLAWVNKPPLSPKRSLRKDSITAYGLFWWDAKALAIHKALAEDAQ